MAVSALGGAFSGQASVSNLRQFRLAGDAKDISIPELAQLQGIEAGPWTGSVSGPVEIEGQLTRGRLEGLKMAAKLDIAASANGRPAEGFVDVSFDQRAGALAFRDSRLSTPATRLQFNGAFQKSLQVALESTDLNDIVTLAAGFGSAAPPSVPIALRKGMARFNGVVSGGLDDPRVSGRVFLSNFLFEGRPFDRLEAVSRGFQVSPRGH